jgi:folate-dependent phosphoribosylglycinamide formyltransferase PurN
MQKSFKRDKNMSFEEFKQKIKEIEFEIFPKAIIEVLSKDLV